MSFIFVKIRYFKNSKLIIKIRGNSTIKEGLFLNYSNRLDLEN